MDEKTFGQEQQHLGSVYRRLLEMKRELEQEIAQVDREAAGEKNDIRDNLRFDFSDDDAKIETYGEIEVWNRYIDSYNVKSDTLSDKLSRVNTLLKAPYFARIRLQFDPEEGPEDYYIGSTSVAENDYDQMVIDWRSPIAETYYNQENGRTSYEVDGRKIPVDLKLRRQFDLSKDKLHSYFDTQIAIEDPMLLESLSRQRTDKMQAITATIQREQNAVIRHPDAPALLVNGIAGSGKTSVLLQRIAYLFYRQRKTLRPDQVFLMTLNPVFSQYIANVLPDLGERNPKTYTWLEFMDSVHCPIRETNYDRTSGEDLAAIDEGLKTLQPEAEFFHGIYQKGTRILSAKDILETLRLHSQIPMGVRLIQITIDELEERARQVLRRRAAGGRDAQESTAPGQDVLDPAAENELQNDNGGAFHAIRTCSWIDYGKIGQRLLGVKRLTAIEWFYLKMALTGECARNAKYVCIDEVQDYTQAQILTLMRYFPNAKFLMLGDEFQAIRPGTVSFRELAEDFDSRGREAVRLSLMTSYRSSPEITDLFTALLPEKERILTTSVQRPGIVPFLCAYENPDELTKELIHLLEEFGSGEGLTAVICENRRSVERIAARLGDRAPHILKAHDSLPERGAVLAELSFCKGLEFDNVILPDADPERYPDEILSRHRRYTAISRATRRLVIVADRRLTGLLANQQ